MISSITGLLEDVGSNEMVLICGGVGYEVLLPTYLTPYYSGKIGETITVYTQFYIQGNPGVGNMMPVLVGFSQPEEREFFGRLLTVEGIGLKAALKALTVPPHVVARAVEVGDVKSLSSLPGLGKQRAAQVIAKLKGKVGKYASSPHHEPEGDSLAPQARPPRLEGSSDGRFFEECLQVMLQLGYKRMEAEDMVRHTLQVNPGTNTVENFINVVFRKDEYPEG